jgi:hypothetical protein
MPKYDTWITDPNPDEIRVVIEYSISPAEPDVGYFSPSVEIESITDTRTNREIELSSIEDHHIEEIEDGILASFSESSEIEADYQHDRMNDERIKQGGTI